MSKKQNTYEVEGKRFKTFAEAAAKAIDVALERGEGVAIVEHGATGTYAITIRAESEQIG